MFMLIASATEVASEVASEVAKEAALHGAEAADSGLLGSLGIDWKIFLAQLVNFSIVAFVLWKWAFTPLLGALDKRQKLIEASVEKAKAVDDRLTKAMSESQAIVKSAHGEAKTIVEAAHAAAAAHRDAELKRTKEEIERIVGEHRAELQAMKTQAVAEAKDELAGIVVTALERMLARKTERDVHEKLVENVMQAVETYGRDA